MRRWLLGLAGLAACTPSPPAPEAACAAVPNVVTVDGRGVAVHEGLVTTLEAGPQDYHSTHVTISDWKKGGLLRPACSGASDVVVGDDRAETAMVLTVGQALARECETPTRYVLASNVAVSLSGVHFCGCRAELPLAFCSMPSLSVEPTHIEMKRDARFIGGEGCSPGSKSMISPSMRALVPTRPPADTRRFESLDAALASLDQPHAGLPECDDAWVTVPHTRWAEAREILSAFHRVRPQQTVIVQVWTPPVEAPSNLAKEGGLPSLKLFLGE